MKPKATKREAKAAIKIVGRVVAPLGVEPLPFVPAFPAVVPVPTLPLRPPLVVDCAKTLFSLFTNWPKAEGGVVLMAICLLWLLLFDGWMVRLLVFASVVGSLTTSARVLKVNGTTPFSPSCANLDFSPPTKK